MRSAVAAGLALIAIPSAAYPPLATDVQLAAVTLASIAELDATVLRRALSSAVDH
jgi:hypothetical protein